MPNEPAKHTPTPWTIELPEEPYSDIEIKSGRRRVLKLWLDDAPVNDFNDEQRANAKLIVKAVNLHAEMLEALKAMQYDDDGTPIVWIRKSVVEAIIAKAEAR